MQVGIAGEFGGEGPPRDCLKPLRFTSFSTSPSQGRREQPETLRPLQRGRGLYLLLEILSQTSAPPAKGERAIYGEGVFFPPRWEAR